MKVFVTGATGFVGEEILRQLSAAGHTIRILARNPRSQRVQEIASQFGAEIHYGNILDATTLLSGLAGCDAVIHLVGIISEIGESNFENVHVAGTRNMASAARHAGVQRFIHMSALGTRAGAVSLYHRSKWAAEEIVRASGLDFTIFRPSIIYGPRDQFVNLFARMSRFSPVLPIMGNGRSKMQPIPVEDVVKCFAGALTEPRTVGQTFDLCGRDAMSFEEILDIILRVLRRGRLKVHVPMGLARMQAALLEFLFSRLLHKPPPLNRDQLLMLQEDNVGNPSPANDLFRLNPVSFEHGISKYLNPNCR